MQMAFTLCIFSPKALAALQRAVSHWAETCVLFCVKFCWENAKTAPVLLIRAAFKDDVPMSAQKTVSS